VRRGARRRIAGHRSATLVLIGGVHKQSTLIQWAKVQAIDVDAGRLVLDKLLTFRGDTERGVEARRSLRRQRGRGARRRAVIGPPRASGQPRAS
jgi:hypothetical protein